jgi:MYXO-CTERM domain-containing protein
MVSPIGPSIARAAALLMSVAALRLPAQGVSPPTAATVSAESAVVGRASGRLLRATASGERPVAGRWVILHRLRPPTGPADSSSGATIDSTRTDATGRFSFRYTRPAEDSTRFFVSASHHGIAYISGALPPDARDETASVTVFDTTSVGEPFRVEGRHILVFDADSTGFHRVAEVYTLSNETMLTRVGRPQGQPVWSAPLPPEAGEVVPGPESARAGDNVQRVDGRAAMLSPIAPGLRRVDFAYTLPERALPVLIAIDAPTPALEVLVEGSGGVATGAGLIEVSPMNLFGRNFRRFQALDVAASTVATIDVTGEPNGGKTPAVPIAIGVGALMAAALLVAIRRRRARPVAVSPTPVARTVPADPETDALARRVAELDAEFAREPAPSDEARARYDATRARLKRDLAHRLAARGGR